MALTVQGTCRRGPFDERDANLIRPLLPHVRRAVEIRDRLRLERVRADLLASSLNNTHAGVVILDEAGHIFEANSIAEQLIRNESAVRRRSDGTLWLREPAGAELYRWIKTGAPPRHSRVLFKVPRPLAKPISVLVSPLSSATTCWTGGDPSWLLLLFDPDRRIAVSAEVLACELRLSAREAEIAAMLATGYDAGVIAARLNISTHTARAHLKSIYSKTGFHSQADLVRAILSGPACVAHTID